MENNARPWKGFVHILCPACSAEITTCLREPATQFVCRECGHKIDLPAAVKAYTNCDCGVVGTYLTNRRSGVFEVPCNRCGSPNAMTYHPGKGYFVPVGYKPKHLRPQKKK